MASRLRLLLALVTLLSLLSLNAGGAKAGVNTSETPGLMEDILTLSISVSSYELMCCADNTEILPRASGTFVARRSSPNLYANMEAWAAEGDVRGWRVADYASNLQLALSIRSCVELYPWDVLH